MRIIGVFLGLTLMGLGAVAADKPTTANGYTVNVEMLVGETGTVEEAKVVSSDEEILNGVALKIVSGLKQEIRRKNGEAVKYRRVAPLFFPVEGDGGPEAQTPLPKPILQPGPIFPYDKIRAEVAGGAILELSVDEKGKVAEVKIVRASQADFGNAAVQAMRKWTFEPLRIGGKATPVHFFQAITFETSASRPDWRWYLAPRPGLPRMRVTGAWVPR